MKQRIVRLLAAAALLVVMLSSAGTAQATRWKFGDTRYFTTEQVCRDGAVVLAGWDKVNSGGLPPPEPGDTSSIRLGVRLYSNTAIPLEPSTIVPTEAYGPLLVPNQTVTMVYNPTGLDADIDDDGDIDKVFNIYARERWYWSRLLDVGAKILVYENSVMLDALVEDCYLHRPEVGKGGTITISNTHLQVDPRISPAADTVFQVNSLMRHGELRLNGVPLLIGDMFTQADIDAGRLSYGHDGSETTEARFGFSVRGITRASVSASGTETSSGSSRNPKMTADGLQIVFESTAPNLVEGDANNVSDIFLRNTFAISTTRVSVSAAGTEANGGSFNPAINTSGSSIAFESDATNLPPTPLSSSCDTLPDTNSARDVYMSQFGGTVVRRVSVGQVNYSTCTQTTNGAASVTPAMGSDSFEVAFASASGGTTLARDPARTDNNNVTDIFRYSSGTTAIGSIGTGFSGNLALNGSSVTPAVSTDGDQIAFSSNANSGLIASDTNSISDIFVHDLSSPNATVRISVATDDSEATSASVLGSFAPAISHDGRFVAFHSYANNLAPDDADAIADIFVRDRDTDADGIFDEPGAVSTQLVSIASDGAQGDGDSLSPAISSNGRFVAFESDATNLVPNDTNGLRDIFLHDRDTDGDGIFDEPGQISTIRISVAANGAQALGGSSANAVISYDGQFIAFDSAASNLVAGDVNSQSDVFVVYSGFTSTLNIAVLPVAHVYLPVVATP